MADQVTTPELRARADYLLSCRIAKLERVLDGSPRVVMELELGITHLKDRHTLLLHTYREEQKTNGNGVVASIVAYNIALTNILNQFLADVSGFGDAGKTGVKP
jgi:ABC-type uncharacterized transport system auxiliary subunit